MRGRDDVSQGPGKVAVSEWVRARVVSEEILCLREDWLIHSLPTTLLILVHTSVHHKAAFLFPCGIVFPSPSINREWERPPTSFPTDKNGGS